MKTAIEEPVKNGIPTPQVNRTCRQDEDEDEAEIARRVERAINEAKLLFLTNWKTSKLPRNGY